jgi:hypothetical protein
MIPQIIECLFQPFRKGILMKIITLTAAAFFLAATGAYADEVVIHRSSSDAMPAESDSHTTVEKRMTPDGCASKTIHKDDGAGDSKTIHKTDCN